MHNAMKGKTEREIVLVALGVNSLICKGQVGTIEEALAVKAGTAIIYN